MLSTKNLTGRLLKSDPLLKKPRKADSSLIPLRGPYINRIVNNSLVFTLSQPGLPSWWRLASPGLN